MFNTSQDTGRIEDYLKDGIMLRMLGRSPTQL